MKKQFRFPIFLKTILMIVGFGLVLGEIAMIYFSTVSSNENKRNYMNAATELSDTVALSIDVDKVKDLTNQVISIYDSYDEKPTREKEGTPEYDTYMVKVSAVKETQVYKDLQVYLNKVKNANGDTEGVYLGYVDYDRKLCIYLVYDEENEAYPVGVIDPLYEEDYPIVENHKLGFVASIYESELDGGYLVTAGAPIVDPVTDEVICYVLVDISMDTIRSKQANSIIRLFIYLIVTVALLSVVGVVIIDVILVRPIKKLHATAKAYDINDPEKTHEAFMNLDIKTHDEIKDLSLSIKKIEDDVHNKIHEITAINEELSASQQETQKMRTLANQDALTGVRNKIAYDAVANKLNDEIKEKPNDIAFGIIMIDLNYLKTINDERGHTSGDLALIKLCNIICAIFAHSPVFRVGGDEFVVILRNVDYDNADKLMNEFNDKINELREDKYLNPEEKASAALGFARYNPKTDNSVDDVFKRADKAMYERKHQMKKEDKTI